MPYAEELADLIQGTVSVRMKRPFARYSAPSAFMPCYTAGTVERDDEGRVIADIANDYAIVADLMNDLVDVQNDLKLRRQIEETIDAVKEQDGDGTDSKGVTAQEVAKRLNLDKQAAQRRLRSAERDGSCPQRRDASRAGSYQALSAHGRKVGGEGILATLGLGTGSGVSWHRR